MTNQPPYQQQPAYGQPSYGRATAPAKPRPSAWWWAIGAGLLVAGLIVGTVFVVAAVDAGKSGVRTMTHTDGSVAADGQGHQVDVPAHSDRMLFAPYAESTGHTCTATDGSGQKLTLSPVSGRTTVTTHGDNWLAFARLRDAGDGTLTLNCSGQGEQIRIGPTLTFSTIGRPVMWGILAAGTYVVLCGAGTLILLITLILWVSRGPRRVST